METTNNIKLVLLMLNKLISLVDYLYELEPPDLMYNVIAIFKRI